MPSKDFFTQFLLSPTGLDKEFENRFKRVINIIAEHVATFGKINNFESRFLSFIRPLYLVAAPSDQGIFILYTNENAVRGHTQWFFLDLQGKGPIENPFEAISFIVERDIGLSKWRGFFIEIKIFSHSDENIQNELLKLIARNIYENNFAEELKRRRVVHINPIFSGRNFFLDPKFVFVLMPFKPEMKPIYDDHIKKICTKLNLDAKRGDDFFTNSSIIEDIWEQMNRARMIIADLTGKNPNVFYEIGMAHTIGKEVIIITQDISDVPFDLRHLRHIQYQYTPPGITQFEGQLENTIISILNK